MLLKGIGFLSTSHLFSLLGPEINISLLKKKKKNQEKDAIKKQAYVQCRIVF